MSGPASARLLAAVLVLQQVLERMGSTAGPSFPVLLLAAARQALKARGEGNDVRP